MAQKQAKRAYSLSVHRPRDNAQILGLGRNFDQYESVQMVGKPGQNPLPEQYLPACTEVIALFGYPAVSSQNKRAAQTTVFSRQLCTEQCGHFMAYVR
jgi:hypothetical protein